jgi:hypothetical protein
VVAAQQQLVATLQQQAALEEANSSSSSSSSSSGSLEVWDNTGNNTATQLLSSSNNNSGGGSSGCDSTVSDNCANHHDQRSLLGSRSCSSPDTSLVLQSPPGRLKPAGGALQPGAGAGTTNPLGSVGLLGRPEGWTGSRKEFVLQYAQQLPCLQEQPLAENA